MPARIASARRPAPQFSKPFHADHYRGRGIAVTRLLPTRSVFMLSSYHHGPPQIVTERLPRPSQASELFWRRAAQAPRGGGTHREPRRRVATRAREGYLASIASRFRHR